MDRAPSKAQSARRSAEVVDFDEALMGACPPDLAAELRAEAEILACAFAPEGRRAELEAMAEALSRGSHDAAMDRRRARGLAAALRLLARRSED